MSSCDGRHCRFEELIRSHVDTAVQDLVDGNHVPPSPPVVERWKIEPPESLLVCEVFYFWHKSGRPSLYPLDLLLVGAVERTPNEVSVF